MRRRFRSWWRRVVLQQPTVVFHISDQTLARCRAAANAYISVAEAKKRKESE